LNITIKKYKSNTSNIYNASTTSHSTNSSDEENNEKIYNFSMGFIPKMSNYKLNKELQKRNFQHKELKNQSNHIKKKLLLLSMHNTFVN